MAMAAPYTLVPCQSISLHSTNSSLTHPGQYAPLAFQGRRYRARVMCSNSGSIKRGAVGLQRFKESAVPGMYWSDRTDLGEEVSVKFTTGSDTVAVSANVGDNLLKVAEQCGAMVVTDNLRVQFGLGTNSTQDFCFEGSCCHCEMEVNGGAEEVGYRAEVKGGELVRSCLCPVPKGRRTVEVNIINSDDGWDDLIV